MKIIAVVITIFLSMGLVEALDPWNADNLTLRVKFTGNIDVSTMGEHPRINWITTKFYMVPENAPNQVVKIIDAYPETYAITTDAYSNRYVNFSWTKPDIAPLEYWIEFEVQTLRRHYEGIDYMQPDEYLIEDRLSEYDWAIKNKAMQLTGGVMSKESVSRMGNWVYNYITYDQDYWSEVSPAVETFWSARGVCDEYSHLLISMLKSINIPARYVEGLVFSGLTWDMHAWVEAYVEDSWQTLDPTYDEYFTIDPTHIILTRTPTNETIKNVIQWQGRDINVFFKNETIDVQVVIETNKLTTDSIKLEFPDEVGLNTLLTAKVSFNEKDVRTCRIGIPKELTLLSNKEQVSVGEPIEWLLLTPEDLKRGYVYKMPIVVSCFPGLEVEDVLVVNPVHISAPVQNIEISDMTLMNQTLLKVTVSNTGSADTTVTLCTTEDCKQTKEVDLRRGASKILLFDDLDIKPGQQLELFYEFSTFSGRAVLSTITPVRDIRVNNGREPAAQPDEVGQPETDTTTDKSSLSIDALTFPYLLLFVVFAVLVIVLVVLLPRFLRK